jgi:hypothetical protein
MRVGSTNVPLWHGSEPGPVFFTYLTSLVNRCAVYPPQYRSIVLSAKYTTLCLFRLVAVFHRLFLNHLVMNSPIYLIWMWDMIPVMLLVLSVVCQRMLTLVLALILSAEPIQSQCKGISMVVAMEWLLISHPYYSDCDMEWHCCHWANADISRWDYSVP